MTVCSRAIDKAYANAEMESEAYGEGRPPLAPTHQLRRRLSALDPNVVDAYASAVEDEPDKGWGAVLISVLHNETPSRAAGHILAIVHALDEIDHSWDRKGTGCWAFEYADILRTGMDHLRLQHVPVPVEAVDEHGQYDRRVTALAAVTTTVAGHDVSERNKRFAEVRTADTDMIYLKDRELAKLVIERPDQAEDIGRIYGQRRGIDAEGVREILDDIARPLPRRSPLINGASPRGR